MNRFLTRGRPVPHFQIVLGLVILVVMLQLGLLTATLNAWFGSEALLWPAAFASAAGCLVNGGLWHCLNRIERSARSIS